MASAEYHAFHNARYRCDNPLNGAYPRYGGRGIKFLYTNLDEMVLDIGLRPDKTYSLDRIDNNGHYVIGNCRWATKKQQMRNIRKNSFVTYNGESKRMVEWTEQLGFSLRGRLSDGWTIDEAVNTPRQKYARFGDITIDDQTRTLGEWAKLHNLTVDTLRHRLTVGWSLDKSLSTPSLRSARNE